MCSQSGSLAHWRVGLWGAVSVVWFLALGAGMSLLFRYANTPGHGSQPPLRWPGASHITRSLNHQATLVMFAHPHCPCTRASLSELDTLMARTGGRASAHVLFVQPTGSAGDLSRTGLWRRAAAIPGVQVLADDGVEAQRFHVETSGDLLLYDQEGRLVYHGGITLMRGHAGENLGLTALQRFLVTGVSERTTSPVFGCPLANHPLLVSRQSFQCQP